MRRPLLAALLALALAPAPASAQVFAPPSLAADLAFAPPTGISRSDFIAGTITDIPAAVAVDGDRIYTVGRTQGGTGGSDIGIIARRSDGSLDSGFSDDGRLIIAIAPSTESDIGTGIVVLPDHRLRVVAATDVVPGGSESLDIAIVGLDADGTPDPTFGTLDDDGSARTGRIVFPAGPSTDVPARIVAGPDGRLAVVGSRSNGSRDDFFVSLREADGTPVSDFGTNGVRFLDRGGLVGGTSMVDRGVDVEFRPGGGLLALVLVETNPSSAFDYTAVLHALDAFGADDPSFSDDGDLVLAVGQPDTVPGGLALYGGRFYITGYTHAGADTNAFLARVEADGSGFDTRSFDMRGRVVPAGQAVVSRALDLAVVPGLPPTLVAAGSIDWVSDTGSTTTDWAAAAFNSFEGPLAAAGFGDVVLQAPGQGGLLSVAAGGNGWAAVAGTHIDASTADNSYGNARLLIDAEKRCDLALSVAEPAEITFRGSAPATLAATVTNKGARACGGTLSASAPYRLAGVSTGILAPGGSMTASAALEYLGPRRAEDFMQVALAAADDADMSNNAALVHLVFRYCDLGVRAVGAAGLVPSEGTRRFAVSLSNSGTTSCRVRIGGQAAYALAGGKRVADRVPGSAPSGARPGARAPVVLRAAADGDVDLRDNAVSVSPVVVGVGDSDVLRSGAQRFSGRAAAGAGRGLKPALLRLTRVDVAVLRQGGGRCGWLTSDRGGFTSRRAGDCGAPRWLRASGTARWRLALRRALAPGRYEVYSRASIGAGFAEARFTARDRNRIEFTIR